MTENLVEALRSYQQADEDGVMVIVSRQACDEAASEITRLKAEVERLTDENAMLRDAEDRWIARLAVVRHHTGDNGKMMLAEFSAWFDKRWNELLTAEASAARMREALGEAYRKGRIISDALKWVDNRYDDQSISHKDFRVEAATLAYDARECCQGWDDMPEARAALGGTENE